MAWSRFQKRQVCFMAAQLCASGKVGAVDLQQFGRPGLDALARCLILLQLLREQHKGTPERTGASWFHNTKLLFT
jgi:hypothetical protein